MVRQTICIAVRTTSLTSGIFGTKLTIRPETISKLINRYGNENLTRFLTDFNIAGSAAALTEKEGRFILDAKSLDTLRERISDTARQGNIPLGAWKIQTPLQEVKNGKIQGFVTPDGIAYIIPDNIESGKLWNVIRHEVGVHLGQLMQGRTEFKGILATLERLRGSDTAQGDLVRKAFATVPKDTKPEHIAEEALAYLVESSPEIGIVRRFITMVKRLWSKWVFLRGLRSSCGLCNTKKGLPDAEWFSHP